MDVQELSCDNNRQTRNVKDLPVTHQVIVNDANCKTCTVPFLDKSSREDPHESSQTHQLHPKFFQHAINGAIELGPAPVQFVVHHLVGIRHTNTTASELRLFIQRVQSFSKALFPFGFQLNACVVYFFFFKLINVSKIRPVLSFKDAEVVMHASVSSQPDFQKALNKVPTTNF